MFGILLLTLLTSLFPATGSISGIVRDADTGEPIPAVQVILHGTLRGTLTDLEGAFVLDRVEPGSYTVEARFVGYAESSLDIEVIAAERTSVRLDLRETTVDLGEITAEATRFPVSSSSVTLRVSDLPGRPRRSSPELLELVPGLIASQHAGGGKAEQLFLRGFDADHGTDVALSLDGMPVNLVSHGHGQGYADLHFFIPETVDAVRVEKGPHAADQGDLATAGSISFKTRERLSENLVRLDAGSFNARRALAMASLPGGNGYVAAALEGTDGPFESPQNAERRHVFLRNAWSLPGLANITVSGGAYQASWTASGQIPERAVETGQIQRFGAITDTEGGTTSRTWITTRAERPVGSGTLSAEAYLSRYTFQLFSDFTFFLDDPSQGDMIEQGDDRLMGGGALGYTHRLQSGGILITGTHGLSTRTDAATIGLWKSPERQQTEVLDNADILQRSFSGWSQWTALLGPQVRLSAGLRMDRFQFAVREKTEPAAGWNEASTSILSPKFSLVYSPGTKVDLFLATGSGFHSNDARSVVRSATSSTPLARAIGSEFGLRLRPSESLLVQAALWRMDISSELVFVGDAGTTEQRGATQRFGVDVGLKAQPMEWLSATADATYARGRFRNAPAGADLIPLAPRLTLSGTVNATLMAGIEAGIRAVHIGSRPLVEDGSLEARSQTLVHLNAGYQWNRVSFDVAVLNVANAEWNEAQFATESRLKHETASVEELHFTPGAPRSVRLGVGYRF